MPELIGMEKLNKRLNAIDKGAPLLRKLQIEATANAKRLVPRKTGNLGRSIHPGSVTDRDAFVWASANYAAAVETGTKPHIIRPRNKRALRFPASGVSTTLGGRVRTGEVRGLGSGAYVFSQLVHHPGTKAQPFLMPAAKKAVKDEGVEAIIELWNAAG